MINRKISRGESGQVNGLLISTILLGIIAAALAGLSVWLYMNYMEKKTDVDGQISSAVRDAKKEQADADNEKFLEREKDPKQIFVGPEDYGRVTFNYPKTWSVYVDDDASDGGDFAAYLNPAMVPPISASQQFALRVGIEDTTYDKAIAEYSSLIKDNKLKTSSFSAGGYTGIRLDGNFTKDIRGSAVVLKIRDKTLTIRTDAETFKADFDALIATIKFND